MAQYADIIEVVVPAQAAPGDRVDVTVRIKNISSSLIAIRVGSVLEYPGPYGTVWLNFDFPETYANVNGGATHSFSGSLIMPESGGTIHIYSYWWGNDGFWHVDDEVTKTITLSALTPQVSEFKIADFNKV